MTTFHFSFSWKQILWVNDVLIVDHKEEASLLGEEIEAELDQKELWGMESPCPWPVSISSLSEAQHCPCTGFPRHTSIPIGSST